MAPPSITAPHHFGSAGGAWVPRPPLATTPLVACINEHVVDEAILLNPECARLETVLRKKAGVIANLFRTSQGRKKGEVLKNSTRFTIYRGECLSALELKNKADLAESLDSYVAITDELIANLVSDVEEMETELAWIHELENSGKAIDELLIRHGILRSNCRYTYYAHGVRYMCCHGVFYLSPSRQILIRIW